MIRGPDFELGVLSGKAKTGTARSVDPLNLTEKKTLEKCWFLKSSSKILPDIQPVHKMVGGFKK